MKYHVFKCVALVQQPVAQIDLADRWPIVQGPIAQMTLHAERAGQS